MIAPELITTERFDVIVDTSAGPARGQTIVDRRPALECFYHGQDWPNIQLSISLSALRLIQEFVSRGKDSGNKARPKRMQNAFQCDSTSF